MAAKGSGQQRKFGAIKPEVVERPGLPVLVEPSGVADFDGWDAKRLVWWMKEQAGRLDDIRAGVGLGLWALRDRVPDEKTYMAEVERLCDVFDVAASTLWRWRTLAQERFRLDPPEGAKRRSAAGLAGAEAKAIGRGNATNGARQTDTREDIEPETDAPPSGDTEAVTSGRGRNLPTPETAGSGTVPDQDPGGVTLAEVALRSPQEPSPSPQSPPVADVLGTGSPPPERSTTEGPALVSRGKGDPLPRERSAALTVPAALDLVAITSVEELRAAGHARLRDAADRLAVADGRKLVLLTEWADLTAELRRLREAPTVPSTPPGAKPAAAVASGGRSGRKTPTTPPTSDPTDACGHPKPWRVLPYGSFCQVEGCGVKVR